MTPTETMNPPLDESAPAAPPPASRPPAIAVAAEVRHLRGSAWYELAAIIAVLLAALLSGCGQALDGATRARTLNEEITEQLFTSAFEMLNVIDDFETDDAPQQIVDRLNQWLLTQKPPADWRPDPMLAALPGSLRSQPQLQALEPLRFLSDDGPVLQEAVWLREAARHAVGAETAPLARAERLFDWTVRNVALEGPTASDGKTTTGAPQRSPWRAMLLGHGSAEARVWVFTLLARQQLLDVVPLAIAPPAADQAPRVWGAGLLLNGELYLFDPRLGLPLRKSAGEPVLTLSQLRRDRNVLASLSRGELKYNVDASDLDHVVAWIEASPLYLSARVQLVEQRLAGPSRLELSTAPSELATRLRACEGVTDVALWPLPLSIRGKTSPDAAADRSGELAPFMAMRGRALWRGRVRHLMGRYTGPQGAIHYYVECRPPDEKIAAAIADKHLSEANAQLLRRAKQDASYWLGLISTERGNFDSAVDYLYSRTLVAVQDGPWTDAARYNLGRAYEQLGQSDEAARQYRAARGPQQLGNLLRADYLTAAR